MTSLEFIHDPKSYGLREFFEAYKNKFPVLVKITQGYCGEIGLETFDKDQVFRIHTYSVQKRVVAQIVAGVLPGFQGSHLSIPISYDMTFTLAKGSTKAHTLRDMLLKYPLPLEVRFAKGNLNSTLKIGAMERSFQNDLKMKLLETYEDTYLLGNVICGGSLYGKVAVMPVYLPGLELSLVTGLGGAFETRYEAVLATMKNQVETYVKFDTSFGNEDIAVYSLEKDSGQVNYQYTSPNEYYNLQDVLENRPISVRKNPYEPIQVANRQDSVYDVIPHDVQIREDSSSSTQTLTNPVYDTNKKGAMPPPVKPKPKINKEEIPKLSAQHENVESDLERPPIPRRASLPSQRSAVPGASLPSQRSAVPGASLPSQQSAGAVQELSSAAHIPSREEINALTICELSEWMIKLKLQEYCAEFQKQLIDGSTLLDLDEELLVKEFRMKKHQAIRLMKFARTGHVPK